MEWADQTSGEVMISTVLRRRTSPTPRSRSPAELRKIRCPVLVVHGTHDLCQPFARGAHIAALAGAELLVLGRASHLPQARYPVVVNHAIDDFARRVEAGVATRLAGPPRVRIVPTALEETMKAREPDTTGYVERDGVRVAWQVYGEQPRPDDPAILLLPTWTIVPAEVWKLQVPYLARRTRVITFDPRGNGASDRPEETSAYARAQVTQDALDVLDATGTERAVVVGLSMGNLYALDLAADHPDRVAAWVAIAPSIAGPRAFPPDRQAAFDRWGEDTGDDEGWGRYNRYSWLRDYPGFLDFFFDQLVPEEHSTKLIEDLVGWGRGTTGEALVRAEFGRAPGERSVAEQCADVTCPVVVVHGTDDRVVPYEAGARLAELTGGTLVTFEGSGHGPQGREPVALNRVLDDTLAGVSGPRPVARRERASRRPKTGALPLLADRARARPPRPGHRRGAARPAPGTRGRVAVAVAGHRLPRAPGGDACTRPRPGWPTRAATSSRSRASTTCTRSRRSGGWTRSWSRTSWSSTTWSASASTTCGSATRPGTSTTSCTRTPRSSGRRSRG